MDANTQILALILSSSVVGGIAVKLIDWIRDAISGQMQKRRAEVDKAIKERDDARADSEWHARHADVLEESLRIHRRRMVDAPCIDPDDMPPYPSRPDRDRS